MSNYLIEMTKEQRSEARSFAVFGSFWLAGVLFSDNYFISAFFAAALWFEYHGLSTAFPDYRTPENTASRQS